MGKPSIQVATLHDCTIEELIKLQSESQSKYARLMLSIVIMRYKGYSNDQIIEVTGTSSVTIQKHLIKWNKFGLDALKDLRGGNIIPKLTPEIVDDLIFVVLNKKPTDFDFIAHTWTCELMKLYIKQNYDIDVSITTIWFTLKSNNLSHKRAQPKPTKADKAEQEAFKKNCTNTRYFRIFI